MAEARELPLPADPVARFRRTVRSTPDRTAVIGPDGTLTFAELDAHAADLATRLRALGIGRGDRVGVSVPRGVDWVVAPLAVWRAGAAYVPLDPAYPHQRLSHIATDADLRALVTDDAAPSWLTGVPVLAPGVTGATPTAPVEPAALDAAYVIYTSGSTGRPKGVEVSRGGVAALTAGLEHCGVYAAGHRVVAWNASMSFDASVQQWVRVCRGDTLVVLDDEDRTDPHRLAALLAGHEVSDLDLTPSHWEALAAQLLPRTPPQRMLRLLIGGEPIPPRMWRTLADAYAEGRIEAFNLYGPTEATVDATVARVEGDGPHLGVPLPQVRAYVLDPALRPAPTGTAGELYLAGPGLARGYTGRPALTAERFVADPFAAVGSRMYRTGDQVRRSATGVLEFLGRADRQVKVRGFRVELGEIEEALRSCSGVVTAVVTVRQGPGEPALVAHYVPAAGTALTAGELRAHTATTLPGHMVPAAFVALDALPMTVNGKVDVHALPEPDAGTDCSGPGPDGLHVHGLHVHGPDGLDGEIEELIAGVWAEVLGRDDIRPDDDFFALGGHSLVALRVVSRLKKRIGVVMPTKDIYRHPRLRDLAEHAASLRAGRTA
ncbi:non-ribosomal peptide synthetase [Streptomyces sp. H27-D2]|uniref:non-ribosomal peptide synthetase n=1 Tax=Streptomyces sp. H27-D2 TaxID=3046304 RepID=UPI002DBF5AB2|nr:non-ribosomal peptide synthetase [Streptomyces sp. H27-D2]MEC4019673.1 non-ribosomal peptide synthetase [Streptomyces sp. H27-D2]